MAAFEGDGELAASGVSLRDGAQVEMRSAGATPSSLVASAPRLGAGWSVTADLAVTRHDFVALVGLLTPAQLTPPGGQVLLVDLFGPVVRDA